MHLVSKINFLKTNFFSIAFALIPFSFIAGNMIVNINIISLIIATLIIHNKKLLNLKFFLVDKIIIIFFIFIITTGLINDIFVFNKLFWGTKFATTIKSLLFLKYLLLYISIRYLIENNFLKFKYFFISCGLATIFVCFDIFYQFIFGVDVFGFKEPPPELRKLGGPFGDELIAGGFIQRFGVFSFFVIPLFFKKKFQYLNTYVITILFIIFFLGIILSGNRMPALLFLLSVILILIFQKQTRKFLPTFIIIFLLVFFTAFNLNSKVKSNFKNFYGQISMIVVYMINLDKNETKQPKYYLKEFSSFYETWQINKFTGGGIKGFRYYCHLRKNIDKKNAKSLCNMHPHNYYLEILTETGLIGFLIAMSFFLITIYLSFYKKYFSKSKLNNNNLIIPFIFLFIVEIFPIKSTGSFFTTGNATYIFILLATLIAIVRRGNLSGNKIK